MTKLGPGSLFLGGSNTYSGTTTIAAGMLEATTSAALTEFRGCIDLRQQRRNARRSSRKTTNAAGGWSDANIGILLSNPSLSMPAGSWIGIEVVGSDSFTSNTNLAAPGAANGVVALNTGTLILTANNAYTGPTTISGGTLNISGGGMLGGGNYAGNIVNNGALIMSTSSSQTLAGVISGSGSLYQTGNAVTTLTATNTYTGNTIITGGTLSIGLGA